MNPAKVDRQHLLQLTDLPNVGPACEKDLRLIGIRVPAHRRAARPLRDRCVPVDRALYGRRGGAAVVEVQRRAQGQACQRSTARPAVSEDAWRAAAFILSLV
ncbi:hypothetical protein XAB3213_4110022 [Xanthomonas citri pv. bilvae]|nr:hypothetical protein XAB3213_4110022 [Xanthomonas citri pv. bilvae]